MNYMVGSPVMMWNLDEKSPQVSINILQSPLSMDSSGYSRSPGSFYNESASPGSNYQQSNNYTSPAYSGSSTPNNMNQLMSNASPMTFLGEQHDFPGYVQNTQNYVYAQPMSTTMPTTSTNPQINIPNYNDIVQTNAPYLEIIEQPEGENRFRYKSEMNGSKHGSLYGCSSSKKGKKKTYPTVKVVNGGFGPITLRCSLNQIPTIDTNGITKYSPHSHKLSRKSDEKTCENGSDYCDVVVNEQTGYQASFEGVGIIHTIRENIAGVLNAKKNIDQQIRLQRLLNSEELNQIRTESENEVKTVELNKVVLKFQALRKNEMTGNYSEICAPVYSNVIKNEKGALTGKLKIVRMKDNFCEAKGQSEHFLLVRKVSKTDIHVRFYELNENSEMGWNEVVRVLEGDVHYQFALILKAPPYWNQKITEPVKVLVELFRSADNCKSAPFEFTYMPNKNTDPSRKRPRRESVMIPDGVDELANQNEMSTISNFQQALGNLEYYGNNPGSSMQASGKSEHDYLSDSQEEAYMMNFNIDFLVSSPEHSFGLDDCNKLAKIFDVDLELECDAVAETYQNEKVGLSEYIKIKSLVQTFKDEWNDKQIQTLLVKIIEKNDENILFALIEEGNLEEIQELAIILHKYKILRYLHEENDVNQNCLHFAVQLKKHHMITPLLKMGLNVNLVDLNGDAPIHLAVNGHYFEGVDKLVENEKLKIDLMDQNGSTALHLAVKNGNLDIVKLLIDSGASYKHKNPKNGNNLMHEAVSSDSCSPEMIKFLLKEDEEFFSLDKNHARQQAFRIAKAKPCSDDILKLLKIEVKIGEKQDDLSESFNNLKLNQEQEILRVFDDQCIKDLSTILDKDNQWQVLALLFEFEAMVQVWESVLSPTVALLFYMELKGKTLDEFVDQLNVIDAREAISAIDEMIVRKMNLR